MTDNKTQARKWFEEVWNAKNSKVIHELMDPQGVGHTEGGRVSGPEHFEQHMFAPLMAAFPDIHVTLDSVIGEADEVALRWTAIGTHSGSLMDISATQKKLTFSGVTWFRFRDGKIIEGWDRWNLHGMLNLLQSGIPSGSASFVES